MNWNHKKEEKQFTKSFVLLEGLESEFQDLVNVFPGKQNEKTRLMIGSKFLFSLFFSDLWPQSCYLKSFLSFSSFVFSFLFFFLIVLLFE